MVDLPENARQWLIESGWHPTRQVEVPDIVRENHPAWQILRECRGLTLLERNCEPDDEPIVEFDFQAQPQLTSVVKRWSKLLGSELVGIAYVHNHHAELFMDESGRCFGNSLMHDAFYFCGYSFAELLVGELEHRRARPMLRPDQGSVRLYGERFTREDPQVFRYDKIE